MTANARGGVTELIYPSKNHPKYVGSFNGFAVDGRRGILTVTCCRYGTIIRAFSPGALFRHD